MKGYIAGVTKPLVYVILGATILGGTALAQDGLERKEDLEIKLKLEDAVKRSKECDNFYWSKVHEKDTEKNLLICEIKSGDEYKQKWTINPPNICSVWLKESPRGYVLDWTGGDDVVVTTKKGDVYKIRLWDKAAKEVYTILQEYVSRNVSPEEVRECQK